MGNERPREGELWSTNMTEMMHVLRDALLRMIPVMDRVRLGWTGPDVSDDWDEIADMFLQVFVLRNVSYSLSDASVISVPKYAFTYDGYSKMSFIEVKLNRGASPPYLVFQSFDTHKNPLDVVTCCHVGANGRRVKDSRKEIPVEDVAFAFQYRQRSGDLQEIDEITIDM